MSSSLYCFSFSCSFSVADKDRLKLMFLFSKTSCYCCLFFHAKSGSSSLLSSWYLSCTIFFLSFLRSSKYFLTALLYWLEISIKFRTADSNYSDCLHFSAKPSFYFSKLTKFVFSLFYSYAAFPSLVSLSCNSTNMVLKLCRYLITLGDVDSSYFLRKTLIEFFAIFHFFSPKLLKMLSKLFSSSFSSFSCLILSAYLALFYSNSFFLSTFSTFST